MITFGTRPSDGREAFEERAGKHNKALQAELESLRAVRDIDRLELDKLLAQLQPHLKEVLDA